jgi:hypothetical protein
MTIKRITEKANISMLPGEWRDQFYNPARDTWLDNCYKEAYSEIITEDLDTTSTNRIQMILEKYVPQLKHRQHRWLFSDCDHCGRWVSHWMEIRNEDRTIFRHCLCDECSQLFVDIFKSL